MTQKPRHIVALLSAAILLFMQATPAFAICACDTPSGETCCQAPPPEPTTEEEHGCCSSEPEEPMESCSDGPTGPSEFASISTPPCEKDVVSSDLSSVTVPETTETRTDSTPTLAVLRASSGHAPAPNCAAFGYLRGPPKGAPCPPIFLLNASFLN